MLELLAVSGFGTLVGMRHALEPDHLAAVTTMVSREQSGRRAALLGVCWGLGHTTALIAAGAVLILAKRQMPARATMLFELLVAAMLIGLGARAVRQAWGRTSLLISRRGGVYAPFFRPLLVGMAHGLAGSGALTALVVTTLPTLGARLAFVALFGVTSTLSMAAASGLLGWPLARLGTRHIVTRSVTLAVGIGSALLGLVWGGSALGAI